MVAEATPLEFPKIFSVITRGEIFFGSLGVVEDKIERLAISLQLTVN
jgi:hypothetical protein